MTALSHKTTLAIAALMAGSSLSGAAQAQTAPAAAEAFAAPVSDTTLQTTAGREDISQIAQANQAAAVSKNSVGDNSATGEVRIADNAFQNMSGLSQLNVNTGNNVAINASMNVNISINPGQ